MLLLQIKIISSIFLHLFDTCFNIFEFFCICRTIINSEKFNDIVCGDCCTSSMRILLKMKPTDALAKSDLIIPRAEFKLPTRGNQAVITFCPATESEAEGTSNGLCSCGRFSIFQDGEGTPQNKAAKKCCHLSDDYSLPSSSECSSSSGSLDTLSSGPTDFGRWFQIRDTLKHFGDVTVNNISLTDLWMNPKLTAQ